MDEYYFDENPYDFVRQIYYGKDPVMAKIQLKKISTIYEMLNLPSSSKVCDVGCGTGYATLVFDGFRKNEIEATSVDISRKSIDLAKRYADEFSVKQEFMVADATSLPFDDDSFDGSFCIGLLHHIDEPKDVIKEMARVSKAVCVVEPNQLNPRQIYYQRTDLAKDAGDTKAFYLKELVKDFESVGLRNIKTKRINFISPGFRGKFLDLMIKSEGILESIPVINLFSGSLVVFGER